MAKEINLLILDDEENILNALKRVFMDEPYGIVTTSDAQKARDVIAQEKIKVVMSDQRMPGLSGVEFLKSIKMQEPDIVRILFTGYADIQAAEDAINKGEVYRFISKPWNDGDLKVTIRQALHKYDLSYENIMMGRKIKKQNEEMLELNAKLKGMYEAQKAFSSTVSHELRTPLSSIKTAIDIVLSNSAGALNGEQQNFLNKAKNNVDRLNRLINDILDLSKLESGKASLKLLLEDMNSIINEVIDIQKAVAEKQGLNVKTQLQENMPKVYFDKDKIHQVLYNLINNAIKFTDKGDITVTSSSDGQANHITVSVKDTGRGIKKEDLPRLFQKFEQLETPTSNIGGTGLGLAICKEIITQHGGKIWAESEFGKGSQFTFILPIQERREGR